jgi:glycosyltransferase involved in cell wall biosynthesis
VRLAALVERMVLVGGLRPPEGEEARYPIPEEISFVPLPYHESLAHPTATLHLPTLRIFWRTLAEVDAVWLFGPHPTAILFALLAAVRRRRVVLGVRQDTVAYVRTRYPRRRALGAASRLLERTFQVLARRFPIVTVGPELARRYRRSSRLLEIVVSLVDESDLVPPDVALQRDYDGELRVLTVGRLEAEKNPLRLAETLARLNQDGARWRLVVCGEGELARSLGALLVETGQADRAELLGYVAFGPELMDLYRSSHALLHMSSTEGLPQVLLEAFAAGLPVVASEVGGIRAAVGDAVLLIPPGDAPAAAAALRAVAADSTLRARLVRAGHEYVASRTIDTEVGRIAGFLADPR